MFDPLDLSTQFKKFHLGCGTIFIVNYLNVGFWPNLPDGALYSNPNGVEGAYMLNHDLVKGIPAADNSLEVVYHSHLLEHLTFAEGIEFTKECFRVLQPGGIIRILVPDLELWCKNYIYGNQLFFEEYRRLGVIGDKEPYVTNGAVFMGMVHSHGHKMCYDFDTLKSVLERAGFQKIRRTMVQDSDLADIATVEPYFPLKAAESMCVECYKPSLEAQLCATANVPAAPVKGVQNKHRDMPKLSIISHYYNHPQMVQDQIAYWESLPDSFLSQVEFVLVDDCSQETPAIRPTKLDLKVFRVVTDLPWNQAGARNLGAINATGEWAMYFDIDQKFYAEPMATLLASLDGLDPMTMFYLRIKELIDITVNKPLASHPNTFLVNLCKFRQYGMYDEDFVGYYGYEDLYVPKVWERNGGKRVLFDAPVFFEDMGFGTTKLDRDLSRNLTLIQQKLADGTRNSPGILRFEWEQLDITNGYGL